MSEVTVTKKHLSASQITSFLACSHGWAQKYILKDYRPPTMSLVKGSEGHRLCESMLNAKLMGETIPDERLISLLNAGLDSEFEKPINYGDADPSTARIECRAQLNACLPYMKAAIAELAPVEIESEQMLTNPDWAYYLKYIMDVETEDGIADFKFTGKKWSQAKADTNTGLTMYALAYLAKHKELPSSIKVINFFSQTTPQKKVTSAGLEIIETTRDARDIQILMQTIKQVGKAIDAEAFLPCDPVHWKCSESFCEYFCDCQFVNQDRLIGGTVNQPLPTQ